MEKFVDLHCHALYGADDGAKDLNESIAMLRVAYEAGTRHICLTPHFNPSYYKKTPVENRKAFIKLKSFAEKAFPELTLYLGNELYFDMPAISWLKSGDCRTVGKKVLVDFSFTSNVELISKAVHYFLNSGYVPILAHAEKYPAHYKNYAAIEEIKAAGAFIHADAESLLGEGGFFMKRFSFELIKRGLIDFVASDAHNLISRPWRLDEAYIRVEDKFGPERARDLFYTVPISILKETDKK